MNIFLFLILNIYFKFCISLEETVKIKEIKYNLRKIKIQKDKKESLNEKIKNKNGFKLSNENFLNRNTFIEIEPNFIITKIIWEKTVDDNFNYLLGIFEGSNDETFLDSIPISIIKEPIKKINYLDINISKKYKYIRYIPPNKNNSSIIPIKIYGFQLSIKLENFNDDIYYQPTNLPLVIIQTEETIEPKRDSDTNCHIKIINEGKLENNENAEIKIRGRSTSMIPPKKPFRIKFSTKQKILNFEGKEKKWTLIANYFDRSLLRNSLAFKISELMDFQFTPRCQPVDVILNGNYRGNYHICDKIEVGNNRVNISKMEKTDISEPNITGGYLLEIDALAAYYEKNYFQTNKGIVGNIEYPEDDEITSEQKTYIISKLNQFEDEIYNNKLDSIDLNSYSRYFLMEEFCGDPDHVWSSFYFTKNRNDEKFYFGPVWDFDLSFDNDNRLIPTNNKTEFCFYYGASAGTTKDFIIALIRNKNVIGNISQIWDKLCDNIINEKVLIDFIEERKQYIKESAELNFLRWDNDEEEIPWDIDFGGKESFEDSIEIVKDYVKNRFKSLTYLINKEISSIK